MAEPAHILAIDDDPSIRRMFQYLLNDAGYRVSTASSGEEALAYLDLITPDLILLDLMLPGINGQEVTERIKADQARPFIPIILVTAMGDQHSKVTGLDAGADDVLVKPVNVAELLARVRAMLRLQRSQRSLRTEQRKTELLLHLTRELGTTLDLDNLLTRFLEHLSTAVGAVRGSIVLTTGDAPRFYSSTRQQPTTPLDIILRNGVVGWALREQRPLVLADTREDGRWIATDTIQRMIRSVAAVPIVREGRTLGAITLVHHTPNYFTDEHLDLLNSVAAQSAIALENAELFRLTQHQKNLLERRATELQQINQISRHVTELMRPDQLVRLVAHLIHHTFGYPMVTILLREGDDLAVRAAAGSHADTLPNGTRLPGGQGVAGWVMAHHEPLYVDDVQQDTRHGHSIASASARSELAVPILTAREAFGVIDVCSEQPGAFDWNDIRLLGTLAGQISVALDNARLFDAEKRRVQQLGQVNMLSVAITASMDPARNLQTAAEALAQIFEVDRCGILITDHTPQLQEMRSTMYGASEAFTELATQVVSNLDLRSPHFIADAAADERLAGVGARLAQHGASTLALAPLLSGGRAIGTILIDASSCGDRFDHAEMTLLETVASLIAQVVENARLYRQVEDERSTLNAVLDGAADPILLIGPHNRLLLANQAADRELGLEGAAGQQIESLIAHPNLLAALRASPNGSNPTSEVTLPDNKTFSISVATVQGANAELIGRVAVMQDISAIKELERREQERLRSVFRRYVSPQVVEQVLRGGGDFGEPREREVVVLFADLRGYTALTEGLEPAVVVEQVLNRYFTAMTEVLHRYEGTIDKFLGDGIIAVFGTPIAHNDDLQRALTAAVDLQTSFARLRQSWRRALHRDIGMGVGLSYGHAVVGNIGSTERLDYTVIGDVVNTASRLNGVAQPGQIIVSHRLIDALPSSWHLPWNLRPIGRVPLKGKQDPHLIYEVEYSTTVSTGR